MHFEVMTARAENEAYKNRENEALVYHALSVVTNGNVKSAYPFFLPLVYSLSL